MSDQDNPAKKTAITYAMVFGVIGIVGFQVIGPQFFERPPGGGVNLARIMWAGIVGGVFGGLGCLIGVAVGRGRK